MEELAQRWTLFFKKIPGLPLTINEEAFERMLQVAVMSKPLETRHRTPRPHYEDDDTTDEGDELPVLGLTSLPRITTDLVSRRPPTAAPPSSPSQSSLQRAVAEVKPLIFAGAVLSKSDLAIPLHDSNKPSPMLLTPTSKPATSSTPSSASAVN